MTPLIVICAGCKHAPSGIGAVKCDVDGLEIAEHARLASCPLGLYGPHPHPWPWIVQQVAKFRSAEDIGIGDTLERGAKAIGGDLVKKVLEAIGQECGCQARRDWLNSRFAY